MNLSGRLAGYNALEVKRNMWKRRKLQANCLVTEGRGQMHSLRHAMLPLLRLGGALEEFRYIVTRLIKYHQMKYGELR